MPPKTSQDGSLLFSGLHFYFLTKSRMQLMMKRVVEHGATLDEAVIPGTTTHIICPPKASQAALTAALPPSKTDKDQQSYELVTQQFVAQCIIKGKRQNEADFRPIIIEPTSPPAAAPATTTTASASAITPSRPLKKQKLDEGTEEEEVKKGGGALVPTPPSTISRPPSATEKEEDKKTWRKEKQQDDDSRDDKEPCIVQRRGSEWIAIQGRKPRFTGGHTGIPWGSYGVWDEPFDPEKARQTIEKLRKHWYVVGGAGGGKDNEEEEQEEEEEETANVTTTNNKDHSTTNGICSHIACSKRRYCLVQLLEEFKKKVYVPGRDQFKIKAIDKAQHILIMYKKALHDDADVDAVGLGTKSAEKVKELLRSGFMERTEVAEKDECVVAYNEFLKVWGVGPGVAEKWYALGCRTIQDVEKKVKEKALTLTEQQKVGLRYLQDFEMKIPRGEIAQAESIVREATFELVEQLGAPNPEKTYCFATGSYRRGKPESSDVDILIVLPDSMPIQDCYDFLKRLLIKLLDQRGLLIDEMGPREVGNLKSRGGGGGSSSGTPHHFTHASWMGVCRIPGKETYRRIDFKLYTYQHGPCAVNYFANSQAFCRATRFWANTATAEAAKKSNPIATGIKISDLEMCPMVKRYIGGGDGNRKEETVPLEPAVQLTCETDLYEMIGLSYVPVTMRYFYEYF